jgi:hypothetical protein
MDIRDEIKHGILRANKKSPNNYMKSLGWTDSRTSYIKNVIFPAINVIIDE